MRSEEIKATLRSIREIICYLYWRFHKTGDGEPSVKDDGEGEGGGPYEPS
jgi:hypothetical protein